MQFDSPSSLGWLALAVPIVVFYILKIRLRRQPVSTVMFWTQVLDEQNPRSIWQRLRHLVSLLLQLAMLLFLALALADPFFSWEVRSARRIVAVIDNSASMNSTDVKPSRLADAKRQAEQLIAGMRHRDEIALVAAGTQPQVIVGFTSRQKTVRNAVQFMSATDGPSHVSEAVALGRRLLGERQDGKQQEVIVFTDGRFDGVENLSSPVPVANDAEAPASGEALAQAPVKLQIIGTRTANLGITQFQVRRSLVDPLGYEILAEVTNASDQAVECRLEVELNGEAIDVVPLKLDAAGKWSQVFEKTSASGGHLFARLNYEDTLVADNTASAVLPRREVQPVVLVTSGNLFLQKVFEVNPLVKLTVVAEAPATIPAGTVVVYHRVTPEKIPPGLAFVIDPANTSDLFEVGEPIANPIVTRQDKDSPLMSHVRLDNVLMPEARQLTPTFLDQTQVLAEAVTKEPLFFAVNRPEGRVLVLTVNLDKGDLPLRTAFPITVANALHWFAGNKGDLRESLAAGSLATVTSNDFVRPAKGQTLVLRSPAGELMPLPASSDRMTIGPLDQCGLWTILEESAGNSPAELTSPELKSETAIPLLEIACNLASATETDVRPPEELLEVKTNVSPIMAGLGSRPLWFWLLLLGLILTTVEWAMYQRRVIS
ncbi:MAG: BatA and WFA domain-containing protein [Planctomycetes bacterium]|nr:BatA and WFA domain-containing protein [Planctomycetota bacterium]